MSLLLSLGHNRDGGPFATYMFDVLQSTSPRPHINDHVRIVSVDEASLAEWGPWPWPRHFLAAIVNNATALGATAVGFDMVFPEPDRHGAERLRQIYQHLDEEVLAHLDKLPEPDHHFASHLSRAPSVMGRIGTETGSAVSDPGALPLNAEVSGPTTGLRQFEGAVANVEALDGVAAGHGLLNGAPDPDGIVRRVPLLGLVADVETPGFALELVRVADDLDEIVRSDDGRSVSFGSYVIETDGDADMRLHFAPFVVDHHISAADVLSGRVPDGALNGKIAIIAAGAVGLGDVVATPLDGEVFGVDLHAQAIAAIREGTWLVRPAWGLPLEWALLIVLGCTAVVLFPGRSFALSGGILVSASLIIVAGTWAAFSELRFLLDPLHPLTGFAATAVVMFAVSFLESEKQQRELQAALTEARIESARVAGELDAAKEIQMGILPDPKAVNGIPTAVEVAALLEPAREIGGDLYDIFMLDEKHLFFVVGDVTGKGVPAALFMSISKVLTKSAISRSGVAVADAIMNANDDIGRDNPADLFVTALAGVLDCETGDLTLVNAGHDDPLILGREEKPIVLRCEGGPPLCVMEGYPYEEEHFNLRPGEVLTIITDGVTEAKNATGDLFGTDRLLSLLTDMKEEAPDELVRGIKKAVRVYEGDLEATDDLTVMAIRRR